MRRLVLLTLREVFWAARLVLLDRNADVLEVFPALRVALTLQATRPQHQLALEQPFQDVQAVCSGEGGAVTHSEIHTRFLNLCHQSSSHLGSPQPSGPA